jgi:endoglucanase
VIAAIHKIDPNRLIISDGLWWARNPIHGLAEDNVVQSTRGYQPMGITHYKASWVGKSDTWPEPTWPLEVDAEQELRWSSDKMNQTYKETMASWGVEIGTTWDSQRIKRQLIDPWKKLQEKGVSVHIGEFGAYIHTPHKVVLAWLRDLMSQWKDAGWGWAMWNLRGGFGILDSNRKDVKYENYKGHKLDREMLELLKEF